MVKKEERHVQDMTQDCRRGDPQCLFCRWIAAGRAVRTLGTVAAFNDGHPVTEGHLLVVPLRHTASGFDMTSREIRDSERLIRDLAAEIRHSDPTVTGFNIGMNIGAAAGQSVFHAHIHLIPRRDGDCDRPKGGVRGVIAGRRSY
jgi:ATP adenylyltransferase